MVNSILKLLKLKRLLLLALLSFLSAFTVWPGLALASEVAASGQHEGGVSLIQVKIKPKSVMLGEKVTLIIEGDALAKSFAKIDWSEYQRHFVVYDVDVSSDRIRVQLYPLASGTFEIKAQTAGLIQLPRMQIRVTENPEVTVQWQRPSVNLYRHQNIPWKADVSVKDVANKITYEARDARLNPSVVTHLQNSAVNTSEGAQGKTERLVASYEVKAEFSANETAVTLHSPAVVVKNRTNKRWYFFDRPMPVVLKPLPSFLPMNVAVGNVTLQSQWLKSWQVIDELNYWTLQLEGTHISKAYLNSLAHQLLTQIPHDDAIEWLSDSRVPTEQLDVDGLHSRLQLRLPYRIKRAGWVTMPALTLQFFNPTSGKLETHSQPKRTVIALPIWLFWIVQWVLLIGFVLLTFFLLLSLKQAWLNRRLQTAIAAANNANELWQAMVDWRNQQTYQAWLFKKREHDTFPMTPTESLGQWSDSVATEFGDSTELQQLIAQLNRAIYAAEETLTPSDWSRLQTQAIRWSQLLVWWQAPWNTLRLMARRLKRVEILR